MSEAIVELKRRVLDAEGKVAYLESLLTSFWTGSIPDNASLDHMVLAAAGKERLAKKAKRAALLVSPKAMS